MTNQDMYKCFEAVAGNGVNVEDSQKAYEEWASTYEQVSYVVCSVQTLL